MKSREEDEFEEAKTLLRGIAASSNSSTCVYEGREGIVYITSYVDLPIVESVLEIRSCPYGVAGISGEKLGNGMKFWEEA